MVSDFIGSSAECSAEASNDMQKTILKIASKTGIPREHIVNAWSFIRDPERKEGAVASDNVHPNLRGMGEIA